MYSLKKYLKTALLILGIYFLTVIAGAMVGSINDDEWIACTIFAVIGGLVYVPMFIYYLYLFFKTRIKLKSAEVKEGSISSWNLVYATRSMAYLIINDGYVDYHTAAVFSRYSAPDMVGRSVSYAIIDDKAVIVELTED